MKVAVVIPVLNEAGNIGPLIDELYRAVASDVLAEVILVDDASTDATAAEIKSRLTDGRHPNLRYLRHAQRRGQSAGLSTGVSAANFPVIASMDGDGQNDPADLPAMLAVLGEPGRTGPALVGGVRIDRKAEGSKRLASKAANWIRDAVLRDHCPDTGCGIKVFWREAFLRLPYFSTMHRYLPALFQTYGYKALFVPVNDRSRQNGVSKYNNISRALIGLYDLVGVSWLRRRTRIGDVVEDVAAAPAVRPTLQKASES